MKKIICFAFLAMFVLVSCQTPQEKADPISNRDAVLSVIHNRKSVRHFIKDKEVGKEDLATLVKAGMAAPTAMNLQPWHFIVVSDRAKLDTLAARLPYAKMLTDVSAAIVVCGDTKVEIQGMSFWMFDCSVASQNILLAAEAMGLGGAWTAVYPDEKRISAVNEVLQIPSHVMPLNVIPVGYPKGEDKPKDKYNEEKVHWDAW